jgi:hypothetical protein
MESCDDKCLVTFWNHEPPGLVEGRFMESKDARLGAYWDHEPGFRKSLEINETIVRFMESPLDSGFAHRDHEPGFRKSLEINETIVRFMESKDARFWRVLGP